MFINFFNQKNNSSNSFKSNNDKNKNRGSNNFSSPFDKNLLNVRWFRILVCFILFLFFLLLWQQVSDKLTLLLFTILPLFIGYGFSYLLEPVNRFFERFFSKKISQFIVFIFFLIFTLSLVLGLFFLFFIQLDDLYRKFFLKTGNSDFEKFLNHITKSNANKPIKDFSFSKGANDTFNGSYSVINEEVTPGIKVGELKKMNFKVNKNEIAGVFVLLLTIASEISIFKDICFTLVEWIYSNLTNYGYLKALFGNLETILLFLYLFLFTIVIAAFSFGKATGFFNKIWVFLTKDYDKTLVLNLKIELKKNLSAWAKGLLLVQLYIFIGSGLFLFTTGIIFASWSSYAEAAIVLTLFMTLCNLVPYIGPTIGFIPIFTIGLIDVVNEGVNDFISWLPLVIAVGGCFLVQVGELTFVSPIVYSKQTKINPIAIIVALGVFGVLFGILWMPLAIPVLLIIKVIYETINQQQQIHEKKNDQLF